MIRIGICDDEAQQRATLRMNLEALLNQKELEYSFFEFSGGEGVCGWVPKHPGEMDLLFLDIEMNGMDGMETARRLHKRDKNLMIVFLTGYADFVFDGYEVGALDYILKPARRDRLEKLLNRALAALHKKAPQVYTIHSPEGIYRLTRGDILYFYSDKRQVFAVTPLREYPFYAKLDEVAAEVDFVRIHQRYLVNPIHVQHIGAASVELPGGRQLPISRALRQQATLALVVHGNGVS